MMAAAMALAAASGCATTAPATTAQSPAAQNPANPASQPAVDTEDEYTMPAHPEESTRVPPF
jgi:type IV pilus biogenesis protein CpaD/CtpE